IEQAVAVPICGDRLGIAVMPGCNRLAAGFELPWRAVSRHGLGAVVGNQVKIALHVANQQIEPAGPLPINSEDGGGRAKVDVFALASQLHRRGECALAFALEEIQLARETARKDVADAVAVQVHKLWRETDTSARRQGNDLATRLEPFELVKLGLVLGADVGVKPKSALVELSHEQDHVAVALQVGHERGGVPHIHVDGTISRLDLNRRREVVADGIGRGQHAGQDAPPHCSFLPSNRYWPNAVFSSQVSHVGERGCVSAPSTPGADAAGFARWRKLRTRYDLEY